MEENPSISAGGDPDLLAGLLKDVSRSFYKTLHILPRPVRPQISLAYLLARTSDTIADSGKVDVQERLSALTDFRSRFEGTRRTPLDFTPLFASQSSKAEETLLRRAEEAITLLKSFPKQDQALIIQVLQTITGGQEQDLLRFGTRGELIQALHSAEELHQYTYLVAGCVGDFWTRICCEHLFKKDNLDTETLIQDGIRFGKGLQLVNILRDLPTDLRHGRCYIPSPELAAQGLTPKDLLLPVNMERFRPVYMTWLRLARDHLEVGWRYTNRLPWRHARVRLACAWPVLIGFETLALLERDNILNPDVRIKVSRRWIKRMIVRSILTYPVPNLWRRLGQQPFCT